MAFSWGGLAKGLLGAGGVIAAPFTGGASLSTVLPAILGTAGAVAGAASGGKSDQRQQENQSGAQFNNAEIARYQTEQAAQNQAGQLDLQRKMFSEDARGGRAKQAALADLLSNLQDISINVPGIQTAQVSGGLRPSTLGATGRQSLAELSKQALAAQLAGDTFTGGNILQGPQIQAPKQAGGTEKALDWIGLLGSLGGGIGSALQEAQKPRKYGVPPDTYSGMQ